MEFKDVINGAILDPPAFGRGLFQEGRDAPAACMAKGL